MSNANQRTEGAARDRFTEADRLSLRVAQYNSTLAVSRSHVRSLIRAGRVYSQLLNVTDRRITVETLASEMAAKGAAMEPWYIHMALAFYDENERRATLKMRDLGEMTMVEAQRACGLRDDSSLVGELLPLYNPARHARWDAAMEGRAA